MLFTWYVLAVHAVHTKSAVFVCTFDTRNPAAQVEMALHSRLVVSVFALDSHCVAKSHSFNVEHFWSAVRVLSVEMNSSDLHAVTFLHAVVLCGEPSWNSVTPSHAGQVRCADTEGNEYLVPTPHAGCAMQAVDRWLVLVW